MSTLTAPSYKRTLSEELRLRCLLVESAHQDFLVSKVKDMLGEERAKRQVPVSLASNPLRRALGVTAILYDQCAVSGVSPRLAELCGEMAAPTTLAKYAAAGLRPMPQGLVEGGSEGGLRDALEYLQACEYVVVTAEWSVFTGRLTLSVARPCDTRVFYDTDDHGFATRIEVDRTRKIRGKDVEVTDIWNLLEPSLRVYRGRRDVTGECDALAGAHQEGALAGDGYWWRWRQGERAGQPYIPCGVYGHPSRTPRAVQLAEGSLEAGVMRTSAMSAMLDAGFPGRNVRNLSTGTSADGSTTGTDKNPGDVTVWHDTDEVRSSEHWEWTAGADVEAMWRQVRAAEADLLSALGYPVDYTQTGGEPLEHEVEARARAIRRWFGICRAGDVMLLERLAAVAGKALGEDIPETGYGALYLDEVTDALAAVAGPSGTGAASGGDGKDPDEEDDAQDGRGAGSGDRTAEGGGRAVGTGR